MKLLIHLPRPIDRDSTLISVKVAGSASLALAQHNDLANCDALSIGTRVSECTCRAELATIKREGDFTGTRLLNALSVVEVQTSSRLAIRIRRNNDEEVL